VSRVVVVDDHALHRDGTRQILEAHPDLQVVGDADSGEVALAVVNQLRPDVVLMDIRLPGMNGIEVTRRLTRDLPDVRVLMVSAYDEDEYVRGALEAGAAGYLRKTAPGKELVQAVRAVAGGASVLQSGLTARLLISTRQPERGVADLTERELEGPEPARGRPAQPGACGTDGHQHAHGGPALRQHLRQARGGLTHRGGRARNLDQAADRRR